MLMIGATGRNVGKTELACAVIRRASARQPVVGVKVTTIASRGAGCPRGGKGCGVCAALDGRWLLTEETKRIPGKDTTRMLAAGARRVLWLRVFREHLREGAEALAAELGPDTVAVCESNSLRRIVAPGAFLMVRDGNEEGCKPTAREVRALADREVVFADGALDFQPDDVGYEGRAWRVRCEATAVVLAGGESRRMGRDKSLLPLDGRPLIAHVLDQLRPHFQEVLVSAGSPDRYRFLGVPVVPDRAAGRGPLMGIACALAATAHERVFFAACDIPEIRIEVVRRMLREAAGCDGVVARRPGGWIEPLFAVYRKSMLPAFEAALAAGEGRVRAVFDACAIRYVDVGEADWLKNVNTPEEYGALSGGAMR
jgi:molybdenum cofactor guanylyltransferase